MAYRSLLLFGFVLTLAIAGGIALAPFMGEIFLLAVGLAACGLAVMLILQAVEWIDKAIDAVIAMINRPLSRMSHPWVIYRRRRSRDE